MPTTRKSRATKKAVKKTAKKRTMTAAHKKALSEGRTASATIDSYMKALHVPKTRGRKVTEPVMLQRLLAAQKRRSESRGIEAVLAAQAVRDIQAKLAAMRSNNGPNMKALEANFVKVGKSFSEKRGISYGAWRDAGVPAAVLRKARIPVTRG